MSSSRKQVSTLTAVLAGSVLALASTSAGAVIIDVSIGGGDAIFLAGRTDLTIPPASDPWTTGTHLIRHGGPTPEEIVETLPPILAVSGGDVIRVADPAVGGVNFFNGLGPPFFGPGGNGLSGSNLTALDGISGYIGPQGPLAGVFLTDDIPSSGPAPATLNFSGAGLGIDFLTLSPLIGQVFYIGDGITSGGDFQEFIAPAGATRLALGIPDGFGFVGAPGAYDDNDGGYRVRIGINQVPVPEPALPALLGAGLLAMGLNRRRAANR
ncbi:MAG: PEP-CTERM sorting domain-containing protein [Gammaproteobacteria bacterium]